MGKILSVRKVQQKYNILEKEARELYKKNNNLKIARGFKDTDEYKKIEKSKKRAINRKVKSISKQVVLIQTKQSDLSGVKPDLSKRKNIAVQAQTIPVVNWIAWHEIFYTVLSYGGKIKLLQSEKERLEKIGKEVTVIIYFVDGSQVATTVDATFLLNIERLYIELMDLESQTDTYPLVDIGVFDVTPQKTVAVVRPTPKSFWIEKNQR